MCQNLQTINSVNFTILSQFSKLNSVNFYNLLVHIVDIVHNDQVTSVATCSGQKQLVTVNKSCHVNIELCSDMLKSVNSKYGRFYVCVKRE